MVDQIPAPPGCVVELVSADDLAEELNDHWDNLAGQSLVSNPFTERWNLQPALQLLIDEQPVKLLLVWQDANRRRLDALIPVVEKRGLIPSMVHLEFWLHRYAYIGMPLLRAESGDTTLSALNRWLDNSHYCLLVFPRCYKDFAAQLQATQPGTFMEDIQERACLNAQKYKDRFTHHSAKKAKEYRRQLRRLEDQHFQLRQLSPSDTAELISDVFLHIEASGWKGKAGTAFLSKQTDEHYLRGIVAAALAADRLGFYYLSKQPLQQIDQNEPGQVVAVLLTIRTGASELLFKTGFDENYARFSPGVLNVLRYSEMIVDGKEISFCDSGAMPDHPMINKVWPDRITLCTLIMRKRAISVAGLLALRAVYQRMKRFARQRVLQKQNTTVQEPVQ